MKTIRLTESQFHNIIKESTYKILNEYIENEPYVNYTSQVIDNPESLKNKYPSSLPNKYYHHSTNKFGRQPFDEREGEKLTLHIIGRLTTDNIDALVVDNPNSENEIPHITLATNTDIKPYQSNVDLKLYRDKIEPLDDYVETTFKNNIVLNKKRQET